jgi:hypothetical protein
MQCSYLLVYNCDKVNGLGYVVPIGRIWALGTREKEGTETTFSLPLRYWDIRHSDGSTTCVPLPNPTGERLGVYVILGGGL